MRTIPSRLHLMAWLAVTLLDRLVMESAADRRSTGLGQLWAFRSPRERSTATDGSRSLTLDVYRSRPGFERVRLRATASRRARRPRRKLERWVDDRLSIRPTQHGHPAGSAGIGRVRDRLSAGSAGLAELAGGPWTTSAKRCAGFAATRQNSASIRIGSRSWASLPAGISRPCWEPCPRRDGPDGVSSRVQAVVSFYGPSDLTALMSSRRLAHEPARVLLGDVASSSADHAAVASPIEHVTHDDPPMLLIHGTDDAWVPLDQSVRMAAALAKRRRPPPIDRRRGGSPRL